MVENIIISEAFLYQFIFLVGDTFL